MLCVPYCELRDAGCLLRIDCCMMLVVWRDMRLACCVLVMLEAFCPVRVVFVPLRVAFASHVLHVACCV